MDTRSVVERRPAHYYSRYKHERCGNGNNEYGKAALGYLAMKDLLGDGLFKKCLQEYMNRWHGKHPIPWDFFNTFRNVSGQNLNWFWNNWFFSHYYIDLAIKNVLHTKTGYTVSVQNIGGMATPFDVVVNYADGTTETRHQTPNVWKTNQTACTIPLATKKERAVHNPGRRHFYGCK